MGKRFGRIAPRVQEIGRPELQSLSVYLELGVVPRADRDDNHNRLGADLSKYQVVRPGDVVFNKLRTWQGGFGVSEHEGLVSPAYFVCRPLDEIEPRWLGYVLRSNPYLAELTRISKWMPPSQFDIAWPDLSSLKIAVPHKSEQRAIADSLDAEMARIDSLLGLRNRQLDLLAQHVQAALLDRLGDWRLDETSSLRQLGTSVFTGPFGTQLAASEYVSGGVPIVNPTHIVDGAIVPSEHESVTEEVANRLRRHRLAIGDLVAGRKGDLGRSALVTDSAVGWVCGSDSIAVRTRQTKLLPEFLAVVLRSGYYRQQLLARSNAATMPSLNEDSLLAFRVPKLSLSDQLGVVTMSQQLRDSQTILRGCLQKQIELIQERKQALITAAVTDQLDLARAITEEAS